MKFIKYIGNITVDPRVEEVNFVVIGEATSREYVAQSSGLSIWISLLLVKYEGNRHDSPQ